MYTWCCLHAVELLSSHNTQLVGHCKNVGGSAVPSNGKWIAFLLPGRWTLLKLLSFFLIVEPVGCACFQGKPSNPLPLLNWEETQRDQVSSLSVQIVSNGGAENERRKSVADPSWCFNLKCNHRRVSFSTVDASKASAASASKCCVSTKPSCCHVQQPSLQENVTWRGQYASSKWTTKKRTWRTMI